MPLGSPGGSEGGTFDEESTWRQQHRYSMSTIMRAATTLPAAAMTMTNRLVMLFEPDEPLLVALGVRLPVLVALVVRVTPPLKLCDIVLVAERFARVSPYNIPPVKLVLRKSSPKSGCDGK